MLVYKIYQRPALVDAEAADPAGRGDAQLLHDGRSPYFPDAGKGFEQFRNLHAGQGVVLKRGADDVRCGSVAVPKAFLGGGPRGPGAAALPRGVDERGVRG